MSQVIIRTESIQGFITGHESDPFYHQKRRFKEDSTLELYLKKKRSTYIYKQQYSLFEILTILEKTIRNEKQYDDNNPCMIICKRDLQEALQVRAILCSTVQYFVLRQMYTKYNTNTSIKDLKPRQRPEDNGYWIIHAPRWAKVSSLAIQIELRQKSNIQKGQVWRINDKLRRHLIKEGSISDQYHLFDYYDLIKRVSISMSKYSDNISDNNNPSAMIIEGTPFEEIFGVRALDSTQYLSFIQTQLLEQIREHQIQDYIRQQLEKQENRKRLERAVFYQKTKSIQQQTKEDLRKCKSESKLQTLLHTCTHDGEAQNMHPQQ